ILAHVTAEFDEPARRKEITLEVTSTGEVALSHPRLLTSILRNLIRGVRNDSMDGHAIAFGPYRLLPAQRLLIDEGNRPVRLGSRAFDIMTALIERAGEVVPKEELIARVWPQTFVEESNLKIQVSSLRRALGDGQDGRRYIVTVPGRGYNFVAPVRQGNVLGDSERSAREPSGGNSPLPQFARRSGAQTRSAWQQLAGPLLLNFTTINATRAHGRNKQQAVNQKEGAR
ncbi:MAG: transcriptional regulator, partial [Bryobacteraceae bacterium]